MKKPLSTTPACQLTMTSGAPSYSYAGDTARLVRLCTACGVDIVTLDTKTESEGGGATWSLGVIGEPGRMHALEGVIHSIESDCFPNTQRQHITSPSHILRIRTYGMQNLEDCLLRLAKWWNLLGVHIHDMMEGNGVEALYDLRGSFTATSSEDVAEFISDMKRWCENNGHSFTCGDIEDNFGLGFDPGLPGMSLDDRSRRSGRAFLPPWQDPPPALPPLNRGGAETIDPVD